MHDPSPEACERRLKLTLEMMAAGIEMTRLSLARRHPEATAAEVETMLAAWLRRVEPPPPGFSLRPLPT